MEDKVQDPYEYEVDLRDYIKVIWREKWIIILVFVVAVGFALGFSLSITPEYKTQASLMITSPLSDQLVNQYGYQEGVVDFRSQFDYKETAFSNDLLQTVITELNLRTDSGKSTPVNSLKKQISLNLRSSDGSNNKAPVLDMTVTGGSKTRIRKIANKWAEIYSKRASRQLSAETKRYFDLISKEYAQVQEELQKKIQERIDYREKYGLQFLQTEVKVMTNKYEDYLSSLMPKRLELEKRQAQLQTLKSALEAEPKYVYLERYLPQESFRSPVQPNDNGENSSEETGESADGGKPAQFPGVKVKDQKVNEIYLSLKEKTINTEVDVASLEQEIEYLESKLSEFRTQIYQKQAKIEKAQFGLEKLEKTIKRLRNSSNSLSSNLEKARNAKERGETPIRIIQEANSTKTVKSVNTKQNVAVAGVLGLFIGVLVAFFKNYMQGYGEEKENEESSGEE